MCPLALHYVPQGNGGGYVYIYIYIYPIALRACRHRALDSGARQPATDRARADMGRWEASDSYRPAGPCLSERLRRAWKRAASLDRAASYNPKRRSLPSVGIGGIITLDLAEHRGSDHLELGDLLCSTRLFPGGSLANDRGLDMRAVTDGCWLSP